MAYYIRKLPNTSTTQLWHVDGQRAVQVGVFNPEQVPGSYFQAAGSSDIWDVIRSQTPWFLPDGQNPFEKVDLSLGEYYPRIARPWSAHPQQAPSRSPDSWAKNNLIAIARGQLTALTRQLNQICQTIHPAPETFATYGHDIRNLLILACTEVEASWRGVLEANGVQKDRFTSNDYVKLNSAMRLDEYAVCLSSYPWLPPIRPFKGWEQGGSPSKNLTWYDAYNGVKHNRENEFSRGTLYVALEALAACAIMLVAQFGTIGALGQNSELSTFFEFALTPVWPIKEIYVYPVNDKTGWKAVHYPFG